MLKFFIIAKRNDLWVLAIMKLIHRLSVTKKTLTLAENKIQTNLEQKLRTVFFF